MMAVRQADSVLVEKGMPYAACRKTESWGHPWLQPLLFPLVDLLQVRPRFLPSKMFVEQRSSKVRQGRAGSCTLFRRDLRQYRFLRSIVLTLAWHRREAEDADRRRRNAGDWPEPTTTSTAITTKPSAISEDSHKCAADLPSFDG